MTEKFRYGLIGAGAMGREHIRNVNIIDHAEIIAIADPHTDSINQSLSLLNNNVKTFESYQEMLDADLVDGYIIATPNYTHIDVLKKIISTNKNLLIEKPMCTTTKDCVDFKNLTKKGNLCSRIDNIFKFPIVFL